MPTGNWAKNPYLHDGEGALLRAVSRGLGVAMAAQTGIWICRGICLLAGSMRVSHGSRQQADHHTSVRRCIIGISPAYGFSVVGIYYRWINAGPASATLGQH